MPTQTKETQNRPEWSPRSVAVLGGPSAVAAFEEAISHFEGFSSNREVLENPARNLEAWRSAEKPHTRALSLLKKSVLDRIFLPDGRVKKDPLKVFNELDIALGERYPSWVHDGAEPALFMINRIVNDIKANVVARMAKHRDKNRMRSQAAAFYMLVGKNLAEFKHNITSHPIFKQIGKNLTLVHIFSLHHQFLEIEKFLEEDPLHPSFSVDRETNNHYADDIFDVRRYAMPTAFFSDEDCSPGKITTVLCTGLPPEHANFPHQFARFTVIPQTMGEKLQLRDKDRRVSMQGLDAAFHATAIDTDRGETLSIHADGCPNFEITRRGELSLNGAPPDALRCMIGPKEYERLRAYFLFRFGELTCREDDMAKIYPNLIEFSMSKKRRKKSDRPLDPKNSKPSPAQIRDETVTGFINIIGRIFPRKAPSRPIGGDSSRSSPAEHDVGQFRRLLPHGFEPNPNKVEEAASAGIELSFAVQLKNGTILSAKQACDEAFAAGFRDVEIWTESIGAFIRFHTFVGEHERGGNGEKRARGNTPTIVQATMRDMLHERLAHWDLF